MTQIEELIRKLLGGFGGGEPVSAITRDLTSGRSPGDPEGRTGIQTRPAQKSSKASKEEMEGFRSLYYDLQRAAERGMPRKILEGVDFEDVKQATPGLTVDAFAPVGNLGLMPDIAGKSREQKKWSAKEDEDLWGMISRGLIG
jgi:hypothetical protein